MITIEQQLPGFNNFFGCWVCTGDINIIIDVGPANSTVRLKNGLFSLGLEKIDYILLTHIHIDHCGGLAEILNHYPMAKVICHDKGLKHIADPTNLWEGSLKVLGKIAKMYGQPQPVAKDRLISHTESDIAGLVVIETPGHAVHHLSYCYQDYLFAGEAGGNFFMQNGTEYLRPATPPRFFFDVCMQSVDRLLALEDRPICYVHCGEAESSHRLLKRFRNQLILWKDIISTELDKSDDNLVTRCIEALLEEDSNLMAFNKMNPAVQERERVFMTNSIKGMAGYLKGNQ